MWTHVESDPATIAPAALTTAKLGAWHTLDPNMRARQLRAFAVMSLQAATLRTGLSVLGALSPANYSDDEHNAAGAAAARTLLLMAPKRPALVSQDMFTVEGGSPIMTDPGTGLGWMALVAAAAVAGAACYLIGRYTGETADRNEFREHKTRQLVSTQATVIEVLTTHAERERLAGKPLPFTDEERRLLESLEHTQQQIATERHQPLPSPFDGAKMLADLGRSASGLLDALLPVAVIGGGIYLLSRFAGNAPPASAGRPPEARLIPAREAKVITLTRNREGVYEQED